MSTIRGTIRHVEGENVTPPTNTTIQSDADSTQRVNSVDVSAHDNTAAPGTLKLRKRPFVAVVPR